jgi:hypothetical protein
MWQGYPLPFTDELFVPLRLPPWLEDAELRREIEIGLERLRTVLDTFRTKITG